MSGDVIPATILGTEIYGQVLLDYDDVAVADFTCGILNAADRTFYFSLPGSVTATIPWERTATTSIASLAIWSRSGCCTAR